MDRLLNNNSNQSMVKVSISPVMLMSIKVIVYLKNSSKNKGHASKNVKDQNESGKPNLDFNKSNSPKQSLVIQ